MGLVIWNSFVHNLLLIWKLGFDQACSAPCGSNLLYSWTFPGQMLLVYSICLSWNFLIDLTSIGRHHTFSRMPRWHSGECHLGILENSLPENLENGFQEERTGLLIRLIAGPWVEYRRFSVMGMFPVCVRTLLQK